MSQNRTIRAILALDYDKRALSGTQKAIDQLNTSLDNARKRALSVEQAAAGLKQELANLARQDAIDQISRDFARAGEEGRDFNATLRETVSRLSAVGASEAEIRGVAQAYRDAAAAANATADATANVQAKQAARGALGVFGTNLKNLPALQISGNLSTDAIGKILQVIDTGLLKLGPAGIAAGAAVVGVGLVFSQFARDFDEYNKRIEARAKAFFAALDEAFDLIFEGATSEEIKARQAEAQTEVESSQARLDELNRLRDEYNALASPVAGGVTVNAPRLRAGQQFLLESTNGDIRNLAQLETAIGEATDALSGAQSEVNAFSSALTSFEVVANDAAEAERIRQNEVTNALQARSEAEAATLKFLEDATVESTRERIAAAQAEINRLLDLNAELQASGGETATALIEENNARIVANQLIVETTTALQGLAGSNGLRGLFDTIEKQGRGAVEGAINAFGDAFGGVIDGAINQVGQIEAIQQKITEAEAKTVTAIDAINKKLADAEAKALADRERGLQDAIDKAQDAREKQEQAHQDRLFAIRQKALTATQNAIGNRDALAFYMAQQQKKTELAEENRANKRKLADISKALKQQTEEVQRRYNEQVAAAKKAASDAINIENQKLQALRTQYNAELTDLQNANAARIALSQSYWTAQQAIDQQGAMTSLQTFQAFWDQIVDTMNLSPIGSGGGTSTGSQMPAAFAGGGFPALNNPVLVGEKGPELAVFKSPVRIYSNSQTRSMLSQNSNEGLIRVDVNMFGQTDDQIISTATRTFHRELSKTMTEVKRRRAAGL